MTAHYQHQRLAHGRWHQLSLAEQLGNVGSEINRASLAQGKKQSRFEAAVFRALELLDLTLSDPRWQKARRLKEIARVRELVVDAFYGGKVYGTRFTDLGHYLDPFAIVARRSH